VATRYVRRIKTNVSYTYRPKSPELFEIGFSVIAFYTSYFFVFSSRGSRESLTTHSTIRMYSFGFTDMWRGPGFQLHISDVSTLQVHLMYLLFYDLLENNIRFKSKVDNI